MNALPTQAEMFTAALDALDGARSKLTDAQHWVRGDWEPVGSPLTDAGVEARAAVGAKCAQMKHEIDQVKSTVYLAIAEQGRANVSAAARTNAT
jgi:hypothetical protein